MLSSSILITLISAKNFLLYYITNPIDTQFRKYAHLCCKTQNRILQPFSCYFPALLIETMFLNALFQNGMYQFLQFHTVYLADHNQLCKGIFLYGYGILFLIGTKLMDADAKPIRNPAHHTKLRLPDARQNIYNRPLRHSLHFGKLHNADFFLFHHV